MFVLSTDKQMLSSISASSLQAEHHRRQHAAKWHSELKDETFHAANNWTYNTDTVGIGWPNNFLVKIAIKTYHLCGFSSSEN